MSYFGSWVRVGLTLLAVVALHPTASADTIAVIGTGDVASGLGPEFARQGHTIVYGSRDPSRARITELVERTGSDASATGQAESILGADAVVLAVPGDVAVEVIRSLGDLSGKFIIDPTNRAVDGDDGALAHGLPPGESNAERIQAAAPDAHVVKAFNTLGVETMVEPGRAGGAVTIPIVGDDSEAKEFVRALIEGMGLAALDLGPLRYARVLEEMLVVWAHAASTGKPFNYYLRPEPGQ